MFGFLKKKPTDADKRGKPSETAEDFPESGPEPLWAPESEVEAEPAEAAAAAAAPDSTPAAPVGPAAEPAPRDAMPEPPTVPAAVAEPPAAAPRRSWSERLKAGLARTRTQLGGGLSGLFGRRKIDEEFLEELETTLLMADCGVDATTHLLDGLRKRWKSERLETTDQLQNTLAAQLKAILQPLEQSLDIDAHKPFVIMLAGVNGSGKTTSIGKLAKHFQARGKSVLLAAGDTFRAAAREQLQTWGERNGVAVIAQEGGDPAAVMFDAVSAARARGIDVVLADTAGRLPTQLHLMEEIAKVRRVINKADPTGPHEVLLVLDANTDRDAHAHADRGSGARGDDVHRPARRHAVPHRRPVRPTGHRPDAVRHVDRHGERHHRPVLAAGRAGTDHPGRVACPLTIPG